MFPGPCATVGLFSASRRPPPPARMWAGNQPMQPEACASHSKPQSPQLSQAVWLKALAVSARSLQVKHSCVPASVQCLLASSQSPLLRHECLVVWRSSPCVCYPRMRIAAFAIGIATDLKPCQKEPEGAAPGSRASQIIAAICAIHTARVGGHVVASPFAMCVQ